MIYNTIDNNIIALNYVIEDGNNICKILESLNILNENCIITEKVDFKAIKERIIKFLTGIKNAIVKFIKKFNDKIKEAFRKLIKSDSINDDMEVINIDYYAKKWQEIYDNRGVLKIFERIGNKDEDLRYTYGPAEAMTSASEEVQSLLDEYEKSPKKTNIKGQSINKALDNLKGIHFDEFLKDIEQTITAINHLTPESMSQNQSLTYNGITKFFTISSTLWQKLMAESITIYNTITKYATDNNIIYKKNAEENK